MSDSPIDSAPGSEKATASSATVTYGQCHMGTRAASRSARDTPRCRAASIAHTPASKPSSRAMSRTVRARPSTGKPVDPLQLRRIEPRLMVLDPVAHPGTGCAVLGEVDQSVTGTQVREVQHERRRRVADDVGARACAWYAARTVSSGLPRHVVERWPSGPGGRRSPAGRAPRPRCCTSRLTSCGRQSRRQSPRRVADQPVRGPGSGGVRRVEISGAPCPDGRSRDVVGRTSAEPPCGARRPSAAVRGLRAGRRAAMLTRASACNRPFRSRHAVHQRSTRRSTRSVTRTARRRPPRISRGCGRWR